MCARETCEKFVYKHLEITEYIENYPTFSEMYNLHGEIFREFLGLRMQNFQGIVFIRTQIYREIFKFSLVYL